MVNHVINIYGYKSGIREINMTNVYKFSIEGDCFASSFVTLRYQSLPNLTYLYVKHQIKSNEKKNIIGGVN